MPYELTEQKKVGLGLIGFGIFFTFLAIILFFDRGLLALGNVRHFCYSVSLLSLPPTQGIYFHVSPCLHLCHQIFWLTGVAILLGWRSTLQLFTNRRNYKGSVSFLLGIFFIFVRWPIVGILVEIYGCFVLFGGFWPTIKAFLYQIPVFGWILQYPILLINQLTKSSS
ncbi:hypothetical protein ACS0TY_023475 [Phlomoides rotata]